MKRRELKELNVIDNFMFNELTTQDDPKEVVQFCTIILQILLGRNLRNVQVIPQKPMQGMDTSLHGICMDVYIEAYTDENGDQVTDVNVRPDIYDVEPNCYEGDEPRRARFYHSLIDARSLQSGVKYKDMKNLFIIMIMTYDPFGQDCMMYTIKNRCLEIQDMPYEDGVTTIFLYTRGTKNIPSREVQDMLHFMEKSTLENAKSDALKCIYHMMENIKEHREVGIRYMKSWEIAEMIREEATREGLAEGRAEGRAEGHAEGLAEGHAEGLVEGQSKTLIRQVCSKLKKGWDVEKVVELLEEEEEVITQIYYLARQHAPEYDEETIFEELSKKRNLSDFCQ